MKAAAAVVAQFAVAFGALVMLLWLPAQFLNDEWDERWLLLLNPDREMPVLDAAMLLVTKLTMPLVLVLMLLWLAGHALAGGRVVSEHAAAWLLRAAGLLLAVGLASSPYWYRTRELVVVYYLGALLVPVSVEFVICSLRRYDRTTLDHLRNLFWLALAAVVLTFLVRNAIAHSLAPRHRPLAEINVDWNAALRRLPDENVRGGSSYVSGHASTVFALVTILAWYVRVRAVQVALIAWALLMAYSRVYVAAHYPFCVLMGSALGMAAGFFTAFILVPDSAHRAWTITRFARAARPGAPG